jgi:hypothetical protein
MTLSICAICQDEAEVIKDYLDCCVHIYKNLEQQLKEVILIDGGSKDNTIEIINSYKDKLPLTLIEYPFDTFGQQKNRALELATGDFILGMDTDMTITTNFPAIFMSGYFNSSNYWDFPMYFTARDKYHYFGKWNLGVNMRLWKRGPLFMSNFHEKLEGQIQGLPVCRDVVIFENSMRQSDEALLNRGRRYQKFAKQMEAEGGGPGSETRYLDASKAKDDEISELPLHIRNLVL